ncbi:HAD family hydrolase [Enterococcus sp. CSURQ0835]|uniref:HAD family hydrolase n=1 Tax=Enterococcus sp. CSURQ0835 TaxID=2681394 RepID=UPI001356A357|nr:HAD-IA family hydrolase [Enterococcus sp. CSURQ0835]
MLQAIIFDMDGVLVDSEYTYFQSKSAILAAAGHPVTETYHYQFMGTTGEYMWQQMKTEFALPESVAHYVQQMNQARQTLVAENGVKAIEGAPALVKRLAKRFPLAVASSSAKTEIEENLAALGLREAFSVVLSSEEVPHSKPAPDVYLEAAARLQVKPENCLGIEDTQNGSLAVKRAGMVCLGYANPSYPTQDLSNADAVLTSFHEVGAAEIEMIFKEQTK